MKGNETSFYKMLENAERENNQITFKETIPAILYDDYPVDDLIFVAKK